LKQIHCPCSVCKGRRRYLLATVREHLIRNGRDDNFRVWRGPESRDTSDDDWEDNFWGPAIERTREVDVQVDTRRMVQETFQGGNDFVTLEEKVQEVASNAFVQADVLHNDYIENHFNDAANVRDISTEEPIGEIAEEGILEGSTFDPQVLEDAIKPLYRGAKSTELAATILLMNLCTVHGVSNNFIEELFALLHGHLLPPDNSLPKNYYAAKSLISKLGLS
jgi:hypothetical protein